MRKTPAIAAILGLAALTLVGCSATGNGCARVDSGDADTAALVTVTGSPTTQPDVEMYTPLNVDDTAFWDVEAGDDSAPITSPEQLVVLDVTLVDGESGDALVAEGYEGDLTAVNPLSLWQQTLPGLGDALECATTGSRVVVALPPGGVEETVASNIGLDEGHSAVAVFDVRKVYLARANGQNQYISGGGMPSIVRAPNGRPGIIVPDAAAPTELVVQVLKKGTGEEVTGDAPVRVHYTGLTWAEREVFETTWDTQPTSVTLETMIPGFAQALEGQTVGSQVLVAIPPELGYGDSSQGTIAPNSTLIFVIDILGIDAPPAAATE